MFDWFCHLQTITDPLRQRKVRVVRHGRASSSLVKLCGDSTLTVPKLVQNGTKQEQLFLKEETGVLKFLTDDSDCPFEPKCSGQFTKLKIN